MEEDRVPPQSTVVLISSPSYYTTKKPYKLPQKVLTWLHTPPPLLLAFLDKTSNCGST